jgi:hypothetical protein
MIAEAAGIGISIRMEFLMAAALLENAIIPIGVTHGRIENGKSPLYTAE